jgi:serine/threonine protein kinase
VKGLEVEEQILRILGKHPRIIQLKGRHEDGLLLEYLPNGSIERYLRSNAPCTTVAQRLRWGQQAAEGLAYVHMKNVIHCDVSIAISCSIQIYRFARQDFPPLEQLPGGDVIRNSWTGVYDDASRAMVDLQRRIDLLLLP